MKTAIISFDPNLAEEFKNKLGDANVRIYIDSISMLKELDEFKPIFIVYDASAGDFAFDDLKFLLSRDKIKGIKFKVLYSKDQPIEDEEILSNDIDIYEKNTEVYKVISDILDESKSFKQEEITEFEEITTQTTFETEDNFEFDMSQNITQEQPSPFQTPESIEEIYSQNLSAEENFEEFTDMSLEDINNNQFEETKNTEFSLKESFDQNINNFGTNETAKSDTVETPKTQEVNSLNLENITLSISKEEIKNAIINLFADKLLSQLKEDAEIKEILENVKFDFVKRMNEELESVKKSIEEEVKANIFKKVEEEMFQKLNTELKDYIAEQIATIIKEKINQAFKT